jgi:hypothetical protein
MSRHAFVPVDGVLQAAPAPPFEQTPGAVAGPGAQPREHTRVLSREWGFDDEVASLEKQRVVVQHRGRTSLRANGESARESVLVQASIPATCGSAGNTIEYQGPHHIRIDRARSDGPAAATREPARARRGRTYATPGGRCRRAPHRQRSPRRSTPPRNGRMPIPVPWPQGTNIIRARQSSAISTPSAIGASSARSASNCSPMILRQQTKGSSSAGPVVKRVGSPRAPWICAVK